MEDELRVRVEADGLTRFEVRRGQEGSSHVAHDTSLTRRSQTPPRGLLAGERLGEEVCDVVVGAHVRHDDLVRLDHVAHEEVPPLHVLHAVVVLGVVRDVARGLAVGAERRRARSAVAQATDELAQVDDVLRSLRQCDDFGLACRLRDALLLSARPRRANGCLLEVIT